MWHPNSQCLGLAASASLTFFSVYSDGTVCVSILVSRCQYRLKSEPTISNASKHAPGDDQYGYEDAGERWMPVHTVESIVRTLHV